MAEKIVKQFFKFRLYTHTKHINAIENTIKKSHGHEKGSESLQMRMSVQKFKMLHNPRLVANVKLRTADVISIIIMIRNSGCHLTLYQSIIYVIVDQLQELQPLFSIENQTKPKED